MCIRDRKKEREEKARVEDLLREVADWRKAQEIRAYAAAVRAALTARGQEDGEATKLGRWLHWAEGVASRYDPLAP